MPRTGRSSSRGARLWGPALVALLNLSGPALAQTYANGAEAYAARDWQAAHQIWRSEADAGSAEALLGLGNLVDFGLLGASDPMAAFDLYLHAAR